MEIDEKKNIKYDLSDHCMVRLKIKIKKPKKEKEETTEK